MLKNLILINVFQVFLRNSCISLWLELSLCRPNDGTVGFSWSAYASTLTALNIPFFRAFFQLRNYLPFSYFVGNNSEAILEIERNSKRKSPRCSARHFVDKKQPKNYHPLIDQVALESKFRNSSNLLSSYFLITSEGFQISKRWQLWD